MGRVPTFERMRKCSARSAEVGAGLGPGSPATTLIPPRRVLRPESGHRALGQSASF
jgi:hypothetical protein